MKQFRLLAVCAAILLFGCTSMPTVNQDPAKNNKVAYNKDLRECQEDYPEVGSGAHVRQWIGCMNLKGWK